MIEILYGVVIFVVVTGLLAGIILRGMRRDWSGK